MFAAAGELAAQAAEPRDDVRGSAEWKRNVVRVFTRRALAAAADERGRRRTDERQERHVEITVTVNGTDHTHDVEPRMLLVDFIRSGAGLTGTHIGCDTTSCGACTVLRRRHADEVVHDVRGAGRRPRRSPPSRA